MKQNLLLSLLFLTLSGLHPLWAQNGFVKGKIVDKNSGEELIGVVVAVDGTTTAVTTNIEGNYTLPLKPGVYTLSVGFMSYQKQIIKEVKIEGGTTKIMDFALLPASVDLKEIVIEARQIKNTDAALISMQSKSLSIQDGVSSQQLSRTGISNAAEGLKQVAGANVEEGKFMVMRGLGDRYSIAQINGLPMPSSDPYRNASSLDLIPAGFIDNIITVKTFTPDQPGNFAGGNMNITSKSFPDKFYLSFSAGQSYNTLSSLNPDFLTYTGGKTDWRGKDDGTRQMPEFLRNDSLRNLLNSTLYIYARNKSSENEAQRRLFNDASQSLSNDFTPDAASRSNQSGFGYQLRQALGVSNAFNRTPLNSNYQFSVGNRWTFNRMEMGASAGAVYSRNFTQVNNGIINTNINAGGEKLLQYQSLRENKSIDNPSLGLLVNASLRYNQKHTFGFTQLYSNDAEKVARSQTGEFDGQVSDSRSVFNTRIMEFTRRELNSSVFNGNHQFALGHGLDVQWSASTTVSRQEEPDLRYFAYTSITDSVDIYDVDGNFSGKKLDTAYYMNNAEYSFPFHFYRNLTDKQNQGKIDITINLNKSQTARLKFGAYAFQMQRDFEEFRYQLNNSGAGGITLDKFNGNIDSLMQASNFGIIDTIRNAAGAITRYPTGWHYINQVSLKNFYAGNQKIHAGYVMGIFPITSSLKAITGARVESTDMLVQSKDTTKSTYVQLNGDTVINPGTVRLTDFLPSVNLIYELSEKAKIRAAFAKTLVRPNMRELAPFAQFDPKNGFFNIGNPGLKRTVIYNYDLRYEFYPNPSEIIAISAYYKLFQDPIIRAFNPKATIPELTFVNVSKAEVQGLEFEFRKSLSFLHPVLKNFSLNTNLTLIRSRVDVPAAEINNARNVDSTFTLQSRPFQGQSPYIVNLILGYTNNDIGHESALFFNVSGRKLYNISLFATPDVYEEAVPMLNFRTSQNIGKYWQLSFSVRNIFNSEISKTQFFRGETVIAESFFIGRTFSAGITFRIR